MRTRLLTAAVLLGTLLVAAPLPGRSTAHAAAGDAAILTGSALHDGDALAGATVGVGLLGWDPQEIPPLVVTVAGDDGAFELQDVPLGPVDVWVRPADAEEGKGWVHGARMRIPGADWIEIDTGDREDDFPAGFPGFGRERGPASAPVTGKIVDASGTPVAGAVVGCMGGGFGVGFRWTHANPDDGSFSVSGGPQRVIVRAAGHRDELVEVEGDGPLTVKLKPVKPTVVRVKGSDGKPLEHAWVRVGDQERVMGTVGLSLFPPIDRHVGAWTDAKGEARIVWSGTRGEEVPVTVFAIGYASGSTTLHVGKAPKTVTLKADKPTTVRVTEIGSDTPVTGALLGLPDSRLPPGSISALPKGQQRGLIVVGRTDGDGRAIVPDLPADVETLQVIGPYADLSVVVIER